MATITEMLADVLKKERQVLASREAVTKQEAWKRDWVRFSVPGVGTGLWEEKDWLNWVTACNGWLCPILNEDGTITPLGEVTKWIP